jgi:hypothetical protein
VRGGGDLARYAFDSSVRCFYPSTRRWFKQQQEQRVSRCAGLRKKLIDAIFCDAAVPLACPAMENAKARRMRIKAQAPYLFVADFRTTKTTVKFAL